MKDRGSSAVARGVPLTVVPGEGDARSSPSASPLPLTPVPSRFRTRDHGPGEGHRSQRPPSGPSQGPRAGRRRGGRGHHVVHHHGRASAVGAAAPRRLPRRPGTEHAPDVLPPRRAPEPCLTPAAGAAPEGGGHTPSQLPGQVPRQESGLIEPSPPPSRGGERHRDESGRLRRIRIAGDHGPGGRSHGLSHRDGQRRPAAVLEGADQLRRVAPHQVRSADAGESGRPVDALCTGLHTVGEAGGGGAASLATGRDGSREPAPAGVARRGVSPLDAAAAQRARRRKESPSHLTDEPPPAGQTVVRVGAAQGDPAG